MVHLSFLIGEPWAHLLSTSHPLLCFLLWIISPHGSSYPISPFASLFMNSFKLCNSIASKSLYEDYILFFYGHCTNHDRIDQMGGGGGLLAFDAIFNWLSVVDLFSNVILEFVEGKVILSCIFIARPVEWWIGCCWQRDRGTKVEPFAKRQFGQKLYWRPFAYFLSYSLFDSQFMEKVE